MVLVGMTNFDFFFLLYFTLQGISVVEVALVAALVVVDMEAMGCL